MVHDRDNALLHLYMIVGAMGIIMVGMFFSLLDLHDDRSDDRVLIAELIEHEAKQVELLCDKGVYVSKEACDGEG